MKEPNNVISDKIAPFYCNKMKIKTGHFGQDNFKINYQNRRKEAKSIYP